MKHQPCVVSTAALYQADGPARERAGAGRAGPWSGAPLPPAPSLRAWQDTPPVPQDRETPVHWGQRCRKAPARPTSTSHWAARPRLTFQLTLPFTGLAGTLQFAEGFLPVA